MFNITGSTQSIIRDMHKVQSRIQKRAEAATVNEVVRTVNKKTIKHVAKVRRVQQKFVKSRVKVFKKAKENRPRSRVAVLTLPLLVRKMPHRVTKRKGVTAGSHKFPSGFGAVVKNGYKGVFQRTGKARYPIETLKIEIEPRFSRAYQNYLRIESRNMNKVFNRRMAQGLARR